MPSAGRTRPNTMPSGSFTTPRHRPVSTITFSATLVNSPKNPFQSPGTHHDGNVVRASLIAFSCSCQCIEQRGRRRDPAEDAALRLDHRNPGLLELGEIGAGAVLQHKAVKATVVRLTHRGVEIGK